MANIYHFIASLQMKLGSNYNVEYTDDSHYVVTKSGTNQKYIGKYPFGTINGIVRTIKNTM
jgi:hypothetical protein